MVKKSEDFVEMSGLRHFPRYLEERQTVALVEDIRGIARQAPFVRPITPWGKPMRVRMTSAGALGWVTDRKGYRYEARHPETDMRWPPIPPILLQIWSAVSNVLAAPDACLINHYGDGARMGLHQDKDEADFSIPVVSISLGDPAVFRVGGLRRSDPTQSFTLNSGDVLVMEGESRLRFHGVDKIKFGANALLKDYPAFGGGRLNITLRRASSVS